MQVPRIPLKFGKESSGTFEEYMAQEAPVSSDEAAEAASDLAWGDTAVGLLARNAAINEFEKTGAPKLSPEEANERFPNISTPFREPVNPYVAQLVADQDMEKQKLSYKISRGPDDRWNKIKQFGAGLIAHTLDPIEFGVGSFAGWGVGGIMARGFMGARVASAVRMVESGGASFATRTGVNVLEAGAGGVIENSVQEAATAFVESREGLEDIRTTGDVMSDIAISTFAATIVGTTIKEGSLQLDSGRKAALRSRDAFETARTKVILENTTRTRNIVGERLQGPEFELTGIKRALRNTSPEADRSVGGATLSSLETELRPDTTPILKTLAQETDVNPGDFGHAAYNYVPVSMDAPVRGRMFYTAAREVSDFYNSTKTPLGDDFGFGIHVTDNPGVANAAASRAMADNPGVVHAVELGDVAAMPLNQPITGEQTSATVKDLLSVAGAQFEPNELANMQASEAFTMIRNAVDEGLLPPEALADLREAIINDGYNALISDGTKHMGYEHSPHNHITILDDTLIAPRNSFDPEPGMVRQVDEADLAAAQARNTDYTKKVFSEPEVHRQNLQRLEEVPIVAKEDAAKIRAETDELIAEMKELHKQGELTDQDLEDIKSIQEGYKDIEDRHKLLKAFALCTRT